MDFNKIKDSIKNNKKYIIAFLVFVLFLTIIIGRNVIKTKIYNNSSTTKFAFFYAKTTKMPSVKINGEKIPYKEYFDLYDYLYNYYKKQSEETGKQIPTSEEIKSEIVGKLVKNSVLNSLADKYNIKVTDREIYDKVKELNDETGGMEITEGLIKENYNMSLSDFEKYFIEPIIIKNKLAIELSNDEKLNKDAIKKINDIHNRLVESGGSYTSKAGQKIDLFEKIAREESEDPASAEKDGDLGWLYSNSTEEAITTAALSLNQGEISDIIKSSTGYHIIKLVDKVDNIDIPKFRIAHIFVKTVDIDSFINEKIEKAKVKIYIK